MVARNLTDESESQTDPSIARPAYSGRPVERLEDTLPLFNRHPGPAVFDKESPTADPGWDHGRLDGRLSGIARGVLQKVPDQTPEKARVTLDAHRFPGHGDLRSFSFFFFFRARGLLGEKCQQIHVLRSLQRVDGVETAGQKELSNQVIELGDVLGHAGADLGTLIGSGELHGDA